MAESVCIDLESAFRGTAMQVVWDYLHFYQKYALSTWHNMTPMQYGYMLVTIAVVGWLCMKSAAR